MTECQARRSAFAPRSTQSSGAGWPRLALFMIFLAVTMPVIARQPFRQHSIVLLQPGFLLEKRVSVKELSSYIDRLNEVAARQAATLSDHAPRAGSIVFAVRPDGSRKVWLDLEPALSEADAGSMVAALEAAAPCVVREGTIVAAMNVGFWGGKGGAVGMPMPEAWRAAITGKDVEVTQLVDSIWPQDSPPEASPERTRE